MSKAAPPRRIEYVALGDVVPAEVNPKSHDLDGIVASIKRNGFVESLVHDGRTGRLIAGHGRLEALARIMADPDAEPPEGVLVENGAWMVPVTYGWSSATDDDAAALLVAVNRLTATGGWIENELAEVLSSLASTEQGLTGTGYADDDLTALLDSLAPLPDVPPLPDPQVQDVDERFMVVVECESEAQQRTLIDRFMGEGLHVKALTS